ncbi:vascular endothelial growth factor receptor 1-like [Penaeus japonicus]|uniref:vascular endothelial growth factor receptor 1-like n=1 Tax=Penaeus japonicus TaxID=27405 RepID=UPI001C71227A|nr:vascular endothelial growth factor receptor 1-like [Penaeus japonicus]
MEAIKCSRDLERNEKERKQSDMGQRKPFKKAFSLRPVIAILMVCFVHSSTCAAPGLCPEAPPSEGERLNTCRIISRGRVSEAEDRPRGCDRALDVSLERHFKAEPPAAALRLLHPPGCEGWSGTDLEPVALEGDFIEGSTERDAPRVSVLGLRADEEYLFYFNGTDQRLQLVAALGARCTHFPKRQLVKREVRRPEVEVKGAWQRNVLANDTMHFYDVEEGAEFALNCSLEKRVDDIHHISWTFESDKQTDHRTTSNFDPLYEHRAIHKAVLSDSGTYSCRGQVAAVDTESISVHINVLEKREKFIFLRSEPPSINTSRDLLKWRLQIRAHPMPEFIWRKGDEVLLNSSAVTPHRQGNHYALDKSGFRRGEVLATISGPLLPHVGSHVIEARLDGGNVTESETFNFTMEAKPEIVSFSLDSPKPIWRRKEEFRISCEAQGYPKPSVSLRFTKCSSKGRCSPEDSVPDGGFQSANASLNELLQETSAGHHDLEAVRERSAWVGRALLPGFFKCVAENSLGKNTSQQIPFYVTDAEGSEPLYLNTAADLVLENGHNLTFVEGEGVDFTCYGNKMLTSRRLRWKLGGEALPRQGPAMNGTLQVAENETEYSYITEVVMGHAPLRMANTELTCYDEAKPEVLVKKAIHIKAMEKPVWKEGQEPLEGSVDRQEQDNLTLSCSATGVPEPSVVWMAPS